MGCNKTITIPPWRHFSMIWIVWYGYVDTEFVPQPYIKWIYHAIMVHPILKPATVYTEGTRQNGIGQYRKHMSCFPVDKWLLPVPTVAVYDVTVFGCQWKHSRSSTDFSNEVKIEMTKIKSIFKHQFELFPTSKVLKMMLWNAKVRWVLKCII